MSFNRLSLLAVTALVGASSVASAADPTPRLSALNQLGQQNINSISSHPRMGGPQGISIHELPGASAHCLIQSVDAIYAVRAGSTAPIPDIQLAHPSHVPGVPGSRPWVSNGPLSHSPGSNRRSDAPYPYSPYPQMSQGNVPSAVSPVSAPATQTTKDIKPIFSPSVQRHADLLGSGERF